MARQLCKSPKVRDKRLPSNISRGRAQTMHITLRHYERLPAAASHTWVEQSANFRVGHGPNYHQAKFKGQPEDVGGETPFLVVKHAKPFNLSRKWSQIVEILAAHPSKSHWCKACVPSIQLEDDFVKYPDQVAHRSSVKGLEFAKEIAIFLPKKWSEGLRRYP